jgi:hypothetical protein
LLSGDLKANVITSIASTKQNILFPETKSDRVWTKNDYTKRYYLTFPFYPFRTLCPRDLHLVVETGSSKTLNFDPTSPLFPANTQINIKFFKRKNLNFLDFMLPYKLDSELGARHQTLTVEQKRTALKFSATVGNATTNYLIKSVNISVKNMYLQVSVTKKK